MRMRYILLLNALLAIMLIFAGCRKQTPTPQPQTHDSVESETQAEKNYYSMDDFKGLIVRESTFQDLVEQVGMPDGHRGAGALSYGMLIEYPAAGESVIYVVVDYDGVLHSIMQKDRGNQEPEWGTWDWFK